jgi:hypothetical protein
MLSGHLHLALRLDIAGIALVALRGIVSAIATYFVLPLIKSALSTFANRLGADAANAAATKLEKVAPGLAVNHGQAGN